MKQFIKNIPASERTGPPVQCTTKSGMKYIVSHNRLKMTFSLYKVIEGGYERVLTGANTPFECYKMVPWGK